MHTLKNKSANPPKLVVLGLLLALVVVAQSQVAPPQVAIITGWDLKRSLTNSLMPEMAWGTSMPFGTFGVGASKSEYSQGEPVILRIAVRNDSDTNLYVYRMYEDGGRRDIKVFLLAANRELVPSILQEKDASRMVRENGRSIDLEPGKADEFGVRLDRLFQLKPNQTYFAYAKKVAGRGVELVSGNAMFTITGASPPSETPGALTATPASSKSAPAAAGAQPKANLTHPKTVPVDSQAAQTLDTKSSGHVQRPITPTNTDQKAAPASASVLGSSIGLLGWLLLGLPLAVLFWILCRAASRARQPRA